jgi:hypothetical protein
MHLVWEINHNSQRAKGMARGVQIPNKLHVPISNDQKDFVLNLGDWDLFEIWCLEFGASI